MKNFTNLSKIEASKIPVDKHFVDGNKSLDFTVTDFWQWALSDLIENRNRGILAEFLVMKALHIQQKTRLEWDAYDLLTPNGIKVEVKSAAYFQSWKQKAKSTISFSIAPKLITDSTTNTPISKRLADVYVFCLLNVSDSETLINPMDMEQWTFFIVKTEELNQKRSNQKTLRLTTLKTLRHIECNYAHLKESLIKTTTLPC